MLCGLTVRPGLKGLYSYFLLMVTTKAVPSKPTEQKHTTYLCPNIPLGHSKSYAQAQKGQVIGLGNYFNRMNNRI